MLDGRASWSADDDDDQCDETDPDPGPTVGPKYPSHRLLDTHITRFRLVRTKCPKRTDRTIKWTIK